MLRYISIIFIIYMLILQLCRIEAHTFLQYHHFNHGEELSCPGYIKDLQVGEERVKDCVQVVCKMVNETTTLEQGSGCGSVSIEGFDVEKDCYIDFSLPYPDCCMPICPSIDEQLP